MSEPTFTVWEDGEEESDGKQYDAVNAKVAAAEHAEAVWESGDPWETGDFFVRKPSGALVKVTVVVEWDPQFFAVAEDAVDEVTHG